MSKWVTINREALEAQIDELDRRIKRLTGGATVTKDHNLAAEANRLTATRDALVHVFNCLT